MIELLIKIMTITFLILMKISERKCVITYNQRNANTKTMYLLIKSYNTAVTIYLLIKLYNKLNQIQILSDIWIKKL